jgi:teichuronic acid biosynthesis glycosyltransferase TuaC
MRVAVVAEFYPRAEDPVLGVWAHRQALAARDAGADLRVFVLHRLIPAKADVAGGPRRAARSLAAKLLQPRRTTLDGLDVTYVPFASPPRGATYGAWGAWAAPVLRRALRRAGPVDLVHAHNAVPAGDAVRRTGRPGPLVVSVHGGDVFYTAARTLNVARTFASARLLLANSAGTAARTRALGAAPGRVEVVRLGTDVPPEPAPASDGPPSIVTVAHLVPRKGHADVLRVLPDLPDVHYTVVGDGPERPRLEALAAELGLAERVRFHGQLPHAEALAVARRCDALVMPSTDEAFGVAYVEQMAAGRPAVGLAGEPGPEEIATLGGGLLLARPGDPADLRWAIRRAVDDHLRLGAEARRTALEHFTWERCGRATVSAYERALRA